MQLRIAIVDDDRNDREQLAADIARLLAGRCVLACHASAEELLEHYVPGSSDLAFLDVRMENLDGIACGMRLRAADPKLLIVFVTSLADYALKAYPTHPFDFLVKPYETERLAHVLADALRALATDEPTVEVTVPYGTVEVELADIVAMEAHNHTVVVHMANGSSLRSTMLFAEAQEKLAPDARFLVVNRGVLVNMDHVARVDGAILILQGGLTFPLRKRDRSALARTITQYLLSRMEGGGTHAI